MNNKFVNMSRELLAVSEDAEQRIQQRSADKRFPLIISTFVHSYRLGKYSPWV